MEKKKAFYNTFKYLLGSVFLIYYRPKFKNKNVIPESGPIILCGNHIHLYDQCLPILSTKRMLHYMAKKEYFDSKFAWFFKKSGCISVDREHHGGNSKEEAKEVLDNGYALGIYPEGTRNSLVSKKKELDKIYNMVDDISYKKFKRIMKKNMTKISQVNLLLSLKEEKKITDNEFKKYIFDVDNSLKELVNNNIISNIEYLNSLLLDIKFGTVSLASKTNATIVPYGIKGKYKLFNNNLEIVFGTPFKVEDNDLESANKRLRNEIISLINNSN